MQAGGAQPPRVHGRLVDWGGDGPLLHLAHANGFPPLTYRRLALALRRRYHVVSMLARPLWGDGRPEDLHDWHELADDLRKELERHGMRGAIGVGHSLGGAMTFLAAAGDPGLFPAIVAVDPLMLSGSMSVFWGTMKALGLGSRLALVRGARSRREHWPSREEARRVYSTKGIFSSWQPEVLEDYLDGGLEEKGGEGFTLRYPREWEARIFEIAPHHPWPQIKKLRVPTLFVRGETSDTFPAASAERIPRVNPETKVVTMKGTSHFIPMEAPEQLAEVIFEFLGR